MHPKGPKTPAQPLGQSLLTVGLQAGQVIPQHVWPLEWWASLGSCGQCPCPCLGAGSAMCVLNSHVTP